MNEWLKVLLEEIRRKRQQRDEDSAEHDRRERPSAAGGKPARAPGRRSSGN